MENEQFDSFTRQMSGAGSSRRQALRALGSVLLWGALGGMAARLGLGDVAEAKKKKDKAKPKPKRQSQVERKGHGQLQAEGKRKGKKRRKKPKPQLCDAYCTEFGGRCCPGGVCADEGTCCPGEKRCIGYTECFAADDCCPNAVPPLCGECDKVVCENGGLVCRPKSTCQQCPAGSESCPGVPWDWYEWLPRGCCPDDHYFPDPRDGRYVCSSPPGQAALWAVCVVASRDARSGRR